MKRAMPLEPGRLDVHYQLTGSLDAAALVDAAAVLSDDERTRAAGIVFERDRRDFIATRALLRRVLSACCGGPAADWRFETGEFGKPALAPSQASAARVSFNVAHTSGIAVCAIAAGAADVGVDVESIRHVDALDLAARFFAPAETVALEACAEADRPLRFVEIWTVKEAFVKALGTGLGTPLDAFVVSFDGDSRVSVAPPPAEDAGRWTLALFEPAPRSRMAVAVRGGGPWTIIAFRHDDDGTVHSEPPLRTSRR